MDFLIQTVRISNLVGNNRESLWDILDSCFVGASEFQTVGENATDPQNQLLAVSLPKVTPSALSKDLPLHLKMSHDGHITKENPYDSVGLYLWLNKIPNIQIDVSWVKKECKAQRLTPIVCLQVEWKSQKSAEQRIKILQNNTDTLSQTERGDLSLQLAADIFTGVRPLGTASSLEKEVKEKLGGMINKNNSAYASLEWFMDTRTDTSPQ